MRVDEIIKYVRGPEVLDVGCAGHRVTPERPDWLHGRLRRKFKVVGIDVSKSNVDLMVSLGYDEVYAQSADTFDLGRRFNTIVAGEVIEHLSNPGLFFANVVKHLAPGGRLVLTTPYAFSLVHAIYAASYYPQTCQNREHTCWLCPATIEELARREGLRVDQLKLIEDFDATVRSWKYRVFWRALKTAGHILPERITKNTILMVLSPV